MPSEMTNTEKHRECLRRAESEERIASKIEENVTRRERRDLEQKFITQKAFWANRSFHTELDIKVKTALATNPLWKSAVGKNQWYISQATMYGIAAMLDALQQGAQSGQVIRS